MASEVILPRVDMDMATGRISKWLVDDGALVAKGQPLFEIETDKAAMEIEAEASGTLQRLAAAGSDDVAVGSVVALIYREGEAAAPGAAPRADLPRDGVADAPPSPPSGAAAASASPASDGIARDAPGLDAAADRTRATPLARRLARERGHDLTALSGTGPRGRVQASDVPGTATSAAPAARPDAVVALRDGPTDAPPGVGTPGPATVPAARPAAGALALFREGEGAPLVLLHGFGADRDGWRPFLAGHGGGRPVLGLDLPGHGAAPLGGDAGFAALVDGVEAALLGAGLGRITLMGHSLGGAVAVAVAARGGVDLGALVLLAPAGLGPEINGGFVEGFLRASSEAAMAPWLRELFADPALATPAFVRLSLRARDAAIEGQRRIAAAVFPDGTQAFSVRADLARVACPVRVVVGLADRIVPARHADALPPLAALHRLTNVGHLPHVEARDTVHAIIRQTEPA